MLKRYICNNKDELNFLLKKIDFENYKDNKRRKEEYEDLIDVFNYRDIISVYTEDGKYSGYCSSQCEDCEGYDCEGEIYKKTYIHRLKRKEKLNRIIKN